MLVYHSLWFFDDEIELGNSEYIFGSTCSPVGMLSITIFILIHTNKEGIDYLDIKPSLFI